MIMAGVTGAQLARKKKITRAAINHIVSGYNKTPRLRRLISRACKLPMDIWAELDRELKTKEDKEKS
jgi:hypothetical protein